MQRIWAVLMIASGLLLGGGTALGAAHTSLYDSRFVETPEETDAAAANGCRPFREGPIWDCPRFGFLP